MPPNAAWPFDDPESARRFAELIQKLKESSHGGVAFFGAGASVPAGLPAWSELYRRFLEHFDAEHSSSSESSAREMRVDFDYHANRDSAKALNFVQTELGGPAPSVPPVVKLVVGTRSLRFFFTTNLDEVLVAAAKGKPVAAYPGYDPMDSRFIYLHGRAATANSFHDDLVLGETGYSSAYGELHAGPAKTQIQRLRRIPVVFIGFSMTDEQVMWTLGDMAEAARRRRVAGEGSGSEVIESLIWYALLKAPSGDDPGRIAKRRAANAPCRRRTFR